MNRSTELAESVLDYWFAIEFLSQDKYPNSFEIQNIVKKHKQEVKAGRASRKSIETFIPITEREFDKSIDQIVKREADECGMQLWGNITFYIGKVKRERCIESIAKIVACDVNDLKPEKSSDSIAVVSLQLSPEGKYVENSLSLSTVIWALNAIKNENANLSEIISSSKYQMDVKGLGKTHFNEEKTQKKLEDDGEFKVANKEINHFAVETVTWKELKSLYSDIYNLYIKKNLECPEEGDVQEVYGLSFQLFSDEKTKKTSENDYLGLSHDYFSNDIQMVLNKLKCGELEKDRYMGNDLIDYIETLSKPIDHRQRINLVHPQSKEELYEHLSEILAIQNAPLGKWPTRYMPALMQQVAINFAISKGNTPLFDINGRVFSVNGPPGTGKTTLLKEIIVNNIVERTILLAKYTNPNDAFEDHKFMKGTKEEGAYSTFTRKWYSIKNDDINNYSMLVTSCNNAAVENISKELPQSMLDDLKPMDDDDEELQKMLSEVSDLFDLKAVGLNETNRDGEKYSDVYFSSYAGNLLRREDTWGLVAAPLGKKSNIKNFYFNVLSPLLYDSFGSNDMMNSRLQRYEKSREEFLAQLKKVEKLRDEISETQNAQNVMKHACVMYDKIKANNNSVISVKRTSIDAIVDEISNIDKCIESKTEALKTLNEDIKKRKSEKEILQKQVTENADLIKQLYEKKIEVCGKVSIFTKIFRHSKYEAVMKLADEYESEALVKKKKQESM